MATSAGLTFHHCPSDDMLMLSMGQTPKRLAFYIRKHELRFAHQTQNGNPSSRPWRRCWAGLQGHCGRPRRQKQPRTKHEHQGAGTYLIAGLWKCKPASSKKHAPSVSFWRPLFRTHVFALVVRTDTCLKL